MFPQLMMLTTACILLFQAAPTPQTATGPAQVINASTQYSNGALLVVILLFVLLGFLFYLLIIWSNRLDQTGYLGTLYSDTIQEIEYKRLNGPLKWKLDTYGYHREILQDPDWSRANPRPEIPDILSDEPWLLDQRLLEFKESDSRWSSSPPTPSYYGTGSGTAEDEKTKEVARKAFDREISRWKEQIGREASQRYNEELKRIRLQAKDRAQKAIKIDLSVLRGRGAEFVLEFTTVVVIIFAAIALGILRILDTQQIGTLLAAIAGYVLGRATTRPRAGGNEATDGAPRNATADQAAKPAADERKNKPEPTTHKTTT